MWEIWDRLNEKGIKNLVGSAFTYTSTTTIAFGLELRKTPKDEIDKRVHEAAKILEIEHLLDRNGDTVRVAFDPHKVHLFDIETEQTILNEAAIM